MTEETKRKISESLKGKNKGRVHTAEARKRMSEGQKGKTTWNKGKTGIYSDETKQKMSAAKKGNKNHLGYKHSELSKQKMRDSVCKSLQEGKHRHLYEIDDLHFDSSWEVYFYLFHKANGNNIERNVCFQLPSGRHTFIDFRVNGQLYEIKSLHFFNSEGHLYNPYKNPDEVVDDKNIEKEEFYNSHSVHIVSDINIYKNYCEKILEISFYRILFMR